MIKIGNILVVEIVSETFEQFINKINIESSLKSTTLK
jgi:hypothetical protein